jgi:spore cortex biosynthesis protein YabQ
MIANQVYVFFWSILVGVVLALIFDFFRISRRKGTTKNFVVYIQDVLYWIIVAIIIIISAFVTNDGELRGYMFIGYAIGAIFYLILFSKLFIKIIGGILDFIENIINKLVEQVVKVRDKMNLKKKNVNN